jgi:hypothetical protein
LRRSSPLTLVLLLLLVASGAWARPSAAQPSEPRSRVVLLEPQDATGELHDALARTRAELTGQGFEVAVKDLPPNVDTRAALEAAAAAANAQAAIAIESVASGADVWVTDRVTGKTSVRSVNVGDLPEAEQPRALAIRAVELLRASLVEAVALPEPEGGPPAPVPDDIRHFVEPRAGPLAGIGAQLGVALLTGFDGIGPAGGPAVRLSFGLDVGLFARLAWAGPAFGAAVEGPLGEATVREEMLTLDVGYAPYVDWAGFSPMIWVGGGFHHLAARGELSPGFVGQSDDVWSAAIVGGAGLGYRITPEVMLLLDAEGVVTLPRPIVTMAGETIATTGRPSLLSTLGVVIRF